MQDYMKLLNEEKQREELILSYFDEKNFVRKKSIKNSKEIMNEIFLKEQEFTRVDVVKKLEDIIIGLDPNSKGLKFEKLLLNESVQTEGNAQSKFLNKYNASSFIENNNKKGKR